jgi:hypothetical protein
VRGEHFVAMWALLEYAMTRFMSLATNESREPKNAVIMPSMARACMEGYTKGFATDGNTTPKR